MAERTFQVAVRLRDFRSRLKSRDLTVRLLLIHGLGWLLTFFVVVNPLSLSSGFYVPVFLFHLFFWFKLVEQIQKNFRPPGEVLLTLFVLLFLVEGSLLQFGNPGSSFLQPNTIDQLFEFAQGLVLACLVLTFSVLLVANNQDKKRVLFSYLLVYYIWNTFFVGRSEFYWVVFQILLFILLLRRTAWLEELTRAECWIYLLLGYLLFRSVLHLNPLGRTIFLTGDLPARWYSLPVFLYLLLKIYLLVVLVKIPVVLVYNHARLARKLWISSLFQSTVPQIIQLCMLLIIFYFFIAGWQAENVRTAFAQQFEQIQMGQMPSALHYMRCSTRDRPLPTFAGYEAIENVEEMPDEGIVALQAQNPDTASTGTDTFDYFLFLRSAGAANDSVTFIKLDTTALRLLTAEVQLLAGSHLLAYPFIPTRWEAQLFKLNFWQEDRNFEIFPFGLIPKSTREALSVPIESPTNVLDQTQEDLFANTVHFTLGRLYSPLFDATCQQIGYYAYDIAITPRLAVITSPLLRLVGLLVAIYLLLNFFVIRRVVKFGTEINRMIVQKFNQLKGGIRHISAGNLDYKVKLEGDDEFVELAERFNTMGDRLKATIAEARDKDRLEHELKIAREVQLGLLPPHLPQVPGYKIVAALKTANEVGGDFYDVLSLDNRRLLFSIGDVSGKGTSAAFYMAQCISLFRFAQQFTDKPGEIAQRLNRYFADPMVDRHMFITAIVGLLDSKTHRLSLVRAGHTIPLILPGKKSQAIRELSSTGLGIGLEKSGELFQQMLQEIEVPLAAGDMVVFYTDGVIEAAQEVPDPSDHGSEGVKFYSEERLSNLLDEVRGHTADELLQIVTDDIDSFYAGHPPVDDFTLLVIQREK